MLLARQLASEIQRDCISCEILGVLDHADDESDIRFFYGGHRAVLSCLQDATMSVYEVTWAYGMILVELDESYQNILKSPHINREKIGTFMGPEIVFFFHLRLKVHLGRAKS